MPNTTLLVILALPVNDRLLIAHVWTLAMIFFTKLLQSLLISLLAVIGTLRYFKGKLHSWSRVICKHSCCRLRGQPSDNICDFCILALSPAHSLKAWRAFMRCYIETVLALQNSIKSSANMRCLRPKLLHYGWNLKPGCLLASFNNLDRYSVEITNNRGERGSPCLNPSSAPQSSCCLGHLHEVKNGLKSHKLISIWWRSWETSNLRVLP